MPTVFSCLPEQLIIGIIYNEVIYSITLKLFFVVYWPQN